MKITKISVYQVDLPMKEGSYSWSNQSFAAFDSTIVIIGCDNGLIGVGETCPLGASYLPAYAEGARTGIAKLAGSLLGQNPVQLDVINRVMDTSLKGHPYVKSALDMACWDIFGKATQQPVYNLLGGLQQDRVKLFKVVTRQNADAMAAKIVDYQNQGFKQFQMKVGAHADEDIERIHKVSAQLRTGNILAADANTGWRQHEAVRVVKAVKDIDFYLEQPCESYEECLAVRQHCDHPMILDECMDSLPMLMRGYRDRAMDCVNVKINRLGGITKARQFRDLCTSLGLTMTIEDSWGSEVATAAIAHLAHSTAPGFHFQSSAFHEYNTVVIADGGPIIEEGTMRVQPSPGLGVTPKMDVLGEAVFETAL